ncbi:hypothetical protein EF879_19450 [Micromonospora sp. HM5-17]|nr:hypothetical protein EF879_19450 [Micromonospora sp. HM5-17]
MSGYRGSCRSWPPPVRRSSTGSPGCTASPRRPDPGLASAHHRRPRHAARHTAGARASRPGG